MGCRILIVDDEPSALVGLKRYFRAAGYDVDAADEREKAEALLAKVPYACALVDLRLTASHGSDGLELLSRARSLCPWMPFIMLTAYGSHDTEEAARRLGVASFLHKPIDLGDLEEIVRNLVGGGV